MADQKDADKLLPDPELEHQLEDQAAEDERHNVDKLRYAKDEDQPRR